MVYSRISKIRVTNKFYGIQHLELKIMKWNTWRSYFCFEKYFCV